MDRLLPCPKDTSFPLEVPFLDTFHHRYIPGGFKNLDILSEDQHGPRSPPLTVDLIYTLSYKEQASCIQAWLFFGLLSEYFGKHVSSNLFVRKTPKEKYPVIIDVRPTAIAALFQDWARKGTARGGKDEHVEILDFATLHCDRLDKTCYDLADIQQNADLRILATVLLSVRLLIVHLRSEARNPRRSVSRVDLARIGSASHL